MELSFRKVAIEPICDLSVDHAAVVADASNLQDHDAVVVIENARVYEDGDNVAGQKWGLDNPYGLQGLAKVDSAAKRIEKPLIVSAANLAAQIVRKNIPSH